MKKQKYLRFLILLLISTGLFVGCQTNPMQGEQRALEAADVERLFKGHTVESYNLNTKNTSFTYYDPNGRVVQERLWSRRTGNWSMTDDGKICLDFKKKTPRCRHIVRKGDTYYKIRPDKSGKPVPVVRYRYFSPGNALGGK